MTINELCKSFEAIAIDARKRLERAEKDKKQPGSHRIDFVRSSAVELIDLMAQQSLNFNAQHRTDMWTNNDILSVMLTAVDMFLRAQGKRLEMNGTTMKIVDL